jgi:hypothetical protein
MADAERKARRELKTAREMIGIYCRGHHGGRGSLCGECEALWGYVQERFARCPFRPDKPTCAHCTVHCYKPEPRDQIRAVMRYAGPRMTWRHPILAFFHLLKGRRPAPPPRRPTPAPAPADRPGGR